MSDNHLNRITQNPDICFRKPVIRNLRYPVESLLDLMNSGMGMHEILRDYPDLELEDLLACQDYAAKHAKQQRGE